MDEPDRWILRNIARRPVEIHRPSGVVVLLPAESLEVAELDAQCLALVRGGALSQHAAPPEAAEQAAPAEADRRVKKRARAKVGANPSGGSRRRRAKSGAAAADADAAATAPRSGDKG